MTEQFNLLLNITDINSLDELAKSKGFNKSKDMIDTCIKEFAKKK